MVQPSMIKITALTAACLAALAAGCGSSGSSSNSSSVPPPSASTPGTTPASNPTPHSPPVRARRVAIAYRNILISPTSITVRTGTKITWTNYDDVQHNVTTSSGPDQFTSPNFGTGAKFSFKTDKPGVIHYLCTIHPASMQGTITVVQ